MQFLPEQNLTKTVPASPGIYHRFVGFHYKLNHQNSATRLLTQFPSISTVTPQPRAEPQWHHHSPAYGLSHRLPHCLSHHPATAHRPVPPSSPTVQSHRPVPPLSPTARTEHLPLPRRAAPTSLQQHFPTAAVRGGLFPNSLKNRNFRILGAVAIGQDQKQALATASRKTIVSVFRDYVML